MKITVNKSYNISYGVQRVYYIGSYDGGVGIEAINKKELSLDDAIQLLEYCEMTKSDKHDEFDISVTVTKDTKGKK